MKDPVECSYCCGCWIAFRDPEGFHGSGWTEEEAREDLERQELDWEDEQTT